MEKRIDKATERALKAYPKDIKEFVGVNGMKSVVDYNSWQRTIFLNGYHQAEKDVAEAFARIIRSNLSMIDKSVQDKFEQLYTDITGEKMYKGFKD